MPNGFSTEILLPEGKWFPTDNIGATSALPKTIALIYAMYVV